MSELAELGEISKELISKETLDEYMANQARIRQEKGPAAKPTPPPGSMPFDPGEKVGQYPRTPEQKQSDLDRIRSDRAKYEADLAEHNAKNPEAKAKPKFKLPKGTKRTAGAVAGIGALTTGAAAMHNRRQRDATG